MPDELAAYKRWKRRQTGGTPLPPVDSTPEPGAEVPTSSSAPGPTVEDYRAWLKSLPGAAPSTAPSVTGTPLAAPRPVRDLVPQFQTPSFATDQLFPEQASARLAYQDEGLRRFQERTGGLWSSRTGPLDVLATPGKAFLEALVEEGKAPGPSDFGSLVRRYEERPPEEQNQLAAFNPINALPFGDVRAGIGGLGRGVLRIGRLTRNAAPLLRPVEPALAASGGERPSQGILGLGGQIEARAPVPLIAPEQVAEARVGQQVLPEGSPAPPAPPAGLVPPVGGTSDKQRMILQARETVRQDRPGGLSGILQKIPGLKQARVWERPGLEMAGENEPVLVAHVAENLAGAHVRAQAMASRVAVDRELAAAFGNKVVEGAESNVRFLGTSEQEASPLTRTLVDIAENPELYDLNTAQKQALANLERRNTGLLQSVNSGYDTEVGQYPAKPGGAFLTHIDVPEDFPGGRSGRDRLSMAGAQSKPRFYETARERLESDPTYKPELNVSRLLDSMDRAKVRAAAVETFRDAVGGLTRLEVMEKTHPNLHNRMMVLRGKLESLRGTAVRLGGNQQDAIDVFLSSPMEAADLVTLQADLNPTVAANAVGRKGANFGKDLRALRAEVQAVKQDIADLRPAWNAADLKPYNLVREGLFRYFPSEQAGMISDLRKVSTNPVLRVLDEIRGGAFSVDLSPFLGVQTPLGVLGNPIGSSRMGAGAIIRMAKDKDVLRSFSSRALAEDMASDPTWIEYASFVGRAPNATPQEFAAGYLGRIPGVGHAINRFTEASYIVVFRQSKGLWESMADSLIKSGVPEMEAKVAAASVSSQLFPMVSGARLGQSPARQAMIRAIPTSVSFIRQPAVLIGQATRGYVKLGLKQTLSPQELLAVRVATTMAASVMSASVVSAVASAEAKGDDAVQAALDAVNPDPKNGRFASLVVGDLRVPLGGPYRALFRAIYPREVKGVPVSVPFAGMVQFAQNRINPAIATQLRLYKNKDFYGGPIRRGDFPAQLLQSLAYEMQGVAPLTIGTAIEGARGIASGKEIATQTIGQFAGANVVPAENAREVSAKYEKSNVLPPRDTSLTVLRTAYYQAGEGLLSDDAKEAWRKYEPLPDRDQKIFLRTLSYDIKHELERVELYREKRRKQLARYFPNLDVLLVEDHWEANRSYTPMTREGQLRQGALRTKKFGSGIGSVLTPIGYVSSGSGLGFIRP